MLCDDYDDDGFKVECVIGNVLSEYKMTLDDYDKDNKHFHWLILMEK
jgi:hypothetical protein